MEHKIEVLSSEIANKIAAGEVVQRPLSVVKELVENSIDAKSENIKIILNNSGLDEIEVIDDGIGMDYDNLKICLLRHATSKIKSEENIYRIMTLGFRGEALPSIAAVSIFKLKTSVDGNLGYVLSKEGDEQQNIEDSPSNKGTHVSVKNLFFNTPARFKHLSSTFYELSLIVQYVNKCALTNPNIKFEFVNNGNVMFSTLGDGNVVNVMQRIYNTEIAKNILEFAKENEHFKVKFYIVKPQITRSRKNNIYISVNDRIIRNMAIENMILKGYGSYLHTNQFPIVFLDIHTDFSLIDINIHPTKEQIKISLIEKLEEIVVEGIFNALNSEEYISKPNNIKDSVRVVDDNFLKKEESDLLDELFKDNRSIETKDKMEELVLKEKELTLEKESTLEKSDLFDNNEDLKIYKKNDDQDFGKKTKNLNFENKFKSKDVNLLDKDNISNEIHEPSQKEYEQNLIKNGTYVGSHHNTYIIYENENGLYFIDQHAAQERIRYEDIAKKLGDKEYVLQKVLIPQTFDFTHDEFLLVEDKLMYLQDLGLYFEKFGPNILRLVEVDSMYLKVKNMQDKIRWIIDTVSKENKLTYLQIVDEIAISIACKGAIKAHDYTTKEDAEILLYELSKCKESYTCPHGRPIIVNLDNYYVQKMFKRVV